MRAADTTPGARDLASGYAVLFSFGNGDGAGPQELLNVNGTFYGTTFAGGARGSCENGSCGTVFSLTPSGKQKVLYRFTGPPDGGNPNGHLIDVNGTLYGTTYAGGKGSYGCGTVFSVTLAGKERPLHRFAGGADGCRPEGGLADVNGTLYGTTSQGGAYECARIGCGTVFSITMAGKKQKLYDFGGLPDGNEPLGALLDVNGTLYGTTYEGGTGGGCEAGSDGCGTVFSVTTAGKERVVYSFGGSRDDDGAYPNTNLLDLNGTLYGTTSAGGAPGSQSYSAGGTVFGVTTTGKERFLHTFTGYADGAEPEAGLVRFNGELYGTTQLGGIGNCRASYGCGIVFSITTAGKEQIRHRFKGRPDGEFPVTTLTNVNGTLYGTTSAGGEYGSGTVFTLKP